MFPDVLIGHPYGMIQNPTVVVVAISIHELLLYGILLCML